MPVSSDVTAGTAALASQFNALRDDVLDATNGHTHTGSVDEGKYIGIVPIGGIIMWSGSIVSIPTHWVICNGSNGTPDLRDRFVIGAGNSYAVAASGGATTKNLAHAHTMAFGSGNESSHTHVNAGAYNTAQDGTGTYTFCIYGATGAGSAHNHQISGTTASGGSATQDILPPYLALAYIQRVS
jgi:hypothetical protein